MKRIGYARVSTIGQSLELQRRDLEHAECDKIFLEKGSGTLNTRPVLKACLDYVREGDILIVTRLDRLARSTYHLCSIAKELESKSVDLCVIHQNIDTSDATGRLLFNMLGAIGQFETELRSERQMEGIAKAKEQGVKFGRQKALDESQIQDLCRSRRRGVKIKDLMQQYKLSKGSIYNYLNVGKLPT